MPFRIVCNHHLLSNGRDIIESVNAELEQAGIAARFQFDNEHHADDGYMVCYLVRPDSCMLPKPLNATSIPCPITPHMEPLPPPLGPMYDKLYRAAPDDKVGRGECRESG